MPVAARWVVLKHLAEELGALRVVKAGTLWRARALRCCCRDVVRRRERDAVLEARVRRREVVGADIVAGWI